MNWITLISLNEIYTTGKTKKKVSLFKDSEIQFLLKDTKELKEISTDIISQKNFRQHYERTMLAKFESYKSFLERNSLKKPQTRFEEADIKTLMGIEEGIANGDLTEIRKQIIEAEESVRGVSLMFFKNEKYLDGKLALIDAVKQMLNVEELASDRDQQYKYVLECKNAKCIVLCENIDFLKRPMAPRKNKIELWYAGGKNIDKLNYTDRRGLPIYYSCDWDYDGLDIFRSVKEIIPEIELLTPNGAHRDIIKTEHESLWRQRHAPSLLSGLPFELYTQTQQTLINQLIKENSWIIEESNDLIKMLSTHQLSASSS